MEEIDRFNNIFDKDPVGILFYNNEGKLIDINPYSLKILEISKLEDFLGVNLFETHYIASKKSELIKKGFIRFQLPLKDFGNGDIKRDVYLSNFGKEIIEFLISVVDYGFLVMVQKVNATENIHIPYSEEKYYRFFEDDLTGDFIATPEGKLIECNPSFLEIYGFDNREKALKFDISQFNIVDWINLINQLRNESKIKGYQSVHTRPDGKNIHVVANLVGIFTDSNELVQVKGYIFDDTERKKAEEFLKQSEEKYHRLFYEDLTGDFIANIDGAILECNPAFAEIYGFNNCEVASNSNISKFNRFDWPYMITRLKKERKLHGFQSWQRRADGLRIHVVANLVGIFNDSNELIRVKGYVFDDTERKNAEEELAHSKRQMREILDSIQDIFFALGTNWNFIYVNQCAAQYFGVEHDDLIGQNLWDIFPEFIGTKFEELFRNAMESGEIQHFEAPSIRNSNQWFDFSIYPSADGISSYWKDITERKVLEEKLRQARDHFEE